MRRDVERGRKHSDWVGIMDAFNSLHYLTHRDMSIVLVYISSSSSVDRVFSLENRLEVVSEAVSMSSSWFRLHVCSEELVLQENVWLQNRARETLKQYRELRTDRNTVERYRRESTQTRVKANAMPPQMVRWEVGIPQVLGACWSGPGMLRCEQQSDPVSNVVV